MKIIYDKEKAIQTKQEIDEKFAKKYTPAKRTLRIALCALCLIVLLCLLTPLNEALNAKITSSLLEFICQFGTAMLVMFIGTVFIGIMVGNICNRATYNFYPDKIKYHALINLPNKTVLNTDVHLILDGMNNREMVFISVDVENPDHTVITERFRISCSGHSFDRKYRTDISEEIFDLDEMVIYKPYLHTKEENQDASV